MDAVLLARVQFALTIGFHFIFPPLTIGLAWLIVWIMWRYNKTKDVAYRTMARFWVRVFALSFAMGVATGITMEFQFGTNWAAYSRFVGDIFGPPLAAEGIFSFFLESSFLGLLLFGEKRLSPRMHLFSALMVAVGATMSAFWIIAANSWQQTPAGYEIVDGRAQLTDFAAALFNPSTVPRFLHTMDAALVTGSFFMLGVSAWYLLKGRHTDFAKRSFRLALVVAFAASTLQLGLGHVHAVQVAHTQPAKLAAFEGLFETQSNAPLILFGIVDEEAARVTHTIEIPGALSILVGNSTDTVVQGLNDFPRDEWPPVVLSGFSFHVMFMLGMFFFGFTGLGVLLLWRGKIFEVETFWGRWYMRLAVLSVPLPFVANELGWIAAEVGRQPWVVWHLLRTRDAVSITVPASQILFSIIMFSVIYALLFCLWVFMLRKKFRTGPVPFEDKGAKAEVAP